MFLRIPKDIYIARYGSDLLILDVGKDKYFSITDKAADLFQVALKTEFIQLGAYYSPIGEFWPDDEKLAMSEAVSQFQERGFLELTDKNVYHALPEPLKMGGLANYQWDYKSSIAPFSKTSKLAIFRALSTLFRVHRLMKKKGIQAILEAIQSSYVKKIDYKKPTAAEVQGLSDAVDVACVFFYKKVFCLGWASTFVLCALNRGWKCNLAIGVQGLPFYAHAWAECDGKVINDDSVVQEYLSVLLREPFKA